MNAFNKKFSFDDFEAVIKSYPQLLDLAENFKETPANLIKLFVCVGQEAIKRSGSAIILELEKELKTFLMSKEINISMAALDSVQTLINEVKKNKISMESKK